MSRQLLFKTLALVAALSCALGASAYDFVQDNIYYSVGSGYFATVTYKSEYGGDYFGDVVIPSTVTHDGITYTVISIGEYAFRSCHDLTSVTLPPTLMFINDRAFYYCTALTSIEIPDGVESIGIFAFYNNEQLTSVTLPSTLTSLGGSCFGVCGNLTSVTCWATTPPSITPTTFADISSSCKLHVPSSVVDSYKSNSNWNSAFNSVVSISYDFKADGIFYKYWTGDDVYVWYEDESSWDPCYFEESYVIPETVTHDGIIHQVTGTGPYVFYNCSNLKEITLPATMKKVSYRTFQGCSALTTVRCLATTPPTTESEVFDNSTYSTATLYVPEGTVNSYSVASTWKNFVNIRPIFVPSYDNYLNIEGGTIHFTSEGDYPWILKEEGGLTYAQSGNAGVASSTSTLTATVTAAEGDVLFFDFKAWGEGTSTYWDKCSFKINGVEQIAYGAYQNSEWETYSVNLPAGECTLEWSYSKDGSVNLTGDYFAIDYVAIVRAVTRGDVNGDGSVNISDVTTLIDYLLSGNASGVNLIAADCNQDSSINISDVTTLIDYLLSGTW